MLLVTSRFCLWYQVQVDSTYWAYVLFGLFGLWYRVQVPICFLSVWFIGSGTSKLMLLFVTFVSSVVLVWYFAFSFIIQRRRFAPSVVSCDSFLGKEADVFLKCLSKKLADKWHRPYS